jgi:hypothetical protein
MAEIERPQLTEPNIYRARRRLDKEIARRLNEKGMGSFVSRHEIQGVLSIEFSEVTEAMHSGNTGAVLDELYDLAVACIVGTASLESGKTNE